MDGSSSMAIHGRAGGIVRVTSNDKVGCSLSTGAVPSEMYSNLSGIAAATARIPSFIISRLVRRLSII